MDKLGDLIAFYRTKQGLTQEQLAKLVDVSASTIGSYEQSYGLPSLAVFNKICLVLRVRPDVLLNYNNINNFQSTSYEGDSNNLVVYRNLSFIDNEVIGERCYQLEFPDADFAMIASDNTMNSAIKKDEVVIIKKIASTNKQIELNQYIEQIVVVSRKAKILLRKLCVKDNNLYLHATNSNYNNIKMNEDILIVGVVLQVLKNC